jgi:dTDP-4-dehydrorhamnose reductase
MRPRILLIGKSGQVGSALCRSLPRVGDVTAFDRSRLDLSKPDEVRTVIRSLRPELIVNAAAYTAVDRAESEPELAHAINADAPGTIAEEAREIGAAVVHYSTDYVFDGTKTTPYIETDPTNPLGVYGKTKLAGEQAIQQSGVPHLILRTAWVYAREGRNFVLTILRLASEREELRIVRDQIGAPTSSVAISEATTNVLSRIHKRDDARAALSTVSGIYHMTASGETSWYDFANAILEEARESKSPAAPWLSDATNQRPLVVRRVTPIATSEYPTPARRPLHSVLSNALLESTFETHLPDWRAELHSFFAETLGRTVR